MSKLSSLVSAIVFTSACGTAATLDAGQTSQDTTVSSAGEALAVTPQASWPDRIKACMQRAEESFVEAATDPQAIEYVRQTQPEYFEAVLGTEALSVPSSEIHLTYAALAAFHRGGLGGSGPFEKRLYDVSMLYKFTLSGVEYTRIYQERYVVAADENGTCDPEESDHAPSDLYHAADVFYPG